MKKVFFLIFSLGLFLLGCTTASSSTTQAPATTTTTTTETVQFTVTFNSDGGSAVASQTVVSGGMATEPDAPTKTDLVFQHWYVSDTAVPYDFSTPVTADLVLTAVWAPIPLTDEEKIAADIAALGDSLALNPYQLSLPSKGSVYRSTIKWSSKSDYITSTGFLLNPPAGSGVTTGVIEARFYLNKAIVAHEFTVELPSYTVSDLTVSRVVPFTNVTTEYEVEDGEVTLYFQEGSTVPYIKLVDFFGLLQGFIDPEVNFTVTKGETTLEMFYQYTDEDTGEIYDLDLTIDATENTITTNDPGFFWAYVYSTATNYGRHIEYMDEDYPGYYYKEGENVVYDLDQYAMDIVMVEGDVVLPFYIVNQVFAGSSYYNVYYNYDGLFGIYALPDAGTDEYEAIKVSTKNNSEIPADLLVHTFNMLAFDFDYFYGLKDIMEVESYYDILIAQRDKLLLNDPVKFDYAIRDYLLKTIDEPHTSYGYPSYFNDDGWEGPEMNKLSYYGGRFTDWYYAGFIDVNDAIGAKWGEVLGGGWNAYGPDRPKFWFLDDVTVSILLDDFSTTDMEESATYDASLANQQLKAGDIAALLPEIAGGTKYFYYNLSTKTEDYLEVLVKGLDETALVGYRDALIALGYTFHEGPAEDENKAAGYFTKTVTENAVEVTYMVQIAFHEEFNLFYVGIMDKAPAAPEGEWPFLVDVLASVQGDSAVYLEMLFDEILAQQPNLENVLLDLSWNTGGNVGALYRIVGFITDQPFAVSGLDRSTGSESTSYVQIVGMPCYSNLNWGLLITPLTFSAANEMATIFMENELGTIIGVQSGGGACSITPILLPNGTAFTMSSNNINAYRTGTGTEADPYVYHNNEFGIAPDVVIAITDIYDAETILQIFVK